MTIGQTDPYLDVLEKRRALEQWKAKKKHEAQEAERQQKRAALEAHLAERARTYFEHTGTTPSTSVLESWQQHYIDEQARLTEAEREARRLASEENYDF